MTFADIAHLVPFTKPQQNYGALSITRQLRNRDEATSERTVGKYMLKMEIKAQ